MIIDGSYKGNDMVDKCENAYYVEYNLASLPIDKGNDIDVSMLLSKMT